MTNWQKVISIFSGIGCLVFASFIFIGYFVSPEDGRIPALMAMILTTVLVYGGGFGIWNGIREK